MSDKPNPQVREGTVWDESRCDEFEMLERLLNEVSMIDNGSGCVGRILKCIEMAKQLNKCDLNTGRPSFARFIHGIAIEDRFGK